MQPNTPALAEALGDSLVAATGRPNDGSGSRSGALKCELILEMHEGFVFADDIPGQTVITHMVTCERLEFAGAGRRLEFDEDGFAALLAPDERPEEDRDL